MDIFANAASYLQDPFVLGSLFVLLAVLAAGQLMKRGVIGPAPGGSRSRLLKLSQGLALGLVVVAVGVHLKHGRLSDANTSAAPAAQGATGGGARELDFGFVELNPGQPTPIGSYKNGGNMVLYAGEELRFQVLGDAPLPPIELRTGDTVQLLPGPEGKVPIAGPPRQALPVLLTAQGSRLSLPGGAPPRIAVKVQVYGGARPR